MAHMDNGHLEVDNSVYESAVPINVPLKTRLISVVQRTEKIRNTVLESRKTPITFKARYKSLI